MKVATVVGARPQFIKAAVVSKRLREEGHSERLIHTGQHYDPRLSRVFFAELEIPEPDVNLGVGSGPHGKQTGEMLAGVEAALAGEPPDWVLVYGDTNSTLAGALAAVKLHLPVAHVEAGLRSFNRAMPEEVNRIVADHLAALHFCPSARAVENLRAEGITASAHKVGDVMYDLLRASLPRVESMPSPAEALGLKPGGYVLATVHRAGNTDDPASLAAVIECLSAAGEPVVFPMHPRTGNAIRAAGFELPPNVHAIEPVSYLTMIALERHARAILTDSGGVQKEALWLGVPCLTMREETEWTETVECGWNRLVGLQPARVRAALAAPRPAAPPPPIYGDGDAAQQIVRLLGGRGSRRAGIWKGGSPGGSPSPGDPSRVE